MKKRNFKRYVLPGIFTLAFAIGFIAISIFNKSLNNKNTNYNYSVSTIKEQVEPVISETKEEIKPIKPFDNEPKVLVDYYSKDDNEDAQQSSLINYETTYMQNTGILYQSDTTFNILATLDGTVSSITEDEHLGNVVEIKHNNNLSTYYYSINDIKVKVNDTVQKGDIIAASGTNNLVKSDNCLLFEVYYQGKTMDPEVYYESNLDSLT